MIIRLRFLGILIGCLLLIPIVQASTVTWSGYTWNLNAHAQSCPGGGNCPTVHDGLLDTNMANPNFFSYDGSTNPFNSNVYLGQEDWCGCTPTGLSYNLFSIHGKFVTLTYSSSTHNYDIETTFYMYLNNSVSGTNCGANVPSTHWLDIEIFYAGRSGTGYIGCSSDGTINYREVENQTGLGELYNLNRLSITALYQRALQMQQLPPNTPGYLSGVEIGVEAFGVYGLRAVFYNATLTHQ